MANKIVIFSSDPGQIRTQLTIDLPFPRDPQSPQFIELLNQIYTEMTTSERERITKAEVEK